MFELLLVSIVLAHGHIIELCLFLEANRDMIVLWPQYRTPGYKFEEFKWLHEWDIVPHLLSRGHGWQEKVNDL